MAGISWPKEYGGRGASLMEQVIFWQEMALAQAPPLANVLGLGIIGATIIAFGTEAQKKRHLAKILSAEEIWRQDFPSPTRVLTWQMCTAKPSSMAITT